MNEQAARHFLGTEHVSWLYELMPHEYAGGGWRGIRRLSAIAEDHTYTFQTIQQRFDGPCSHLPYGPTFSEYDK